MFRRILRGVFDENDITDETWEDLEAAMIQADMGVDTTIFLVDELRERAEKQKIRKSELLIPTLKELSLIHI